MWHWHVLTSTVAVELSERLKIEGGDHNGRRKNGWIETIVCLRTRAKRLELFVRIVYAWICIGVVLVVYGFIAEICMFIQWFVILILGRRSEGLSNFIKGYLDYFVHVLSYYYFMTDDRPGILPKPVEIYEKK